MRNLVTMGSKTNYRMYWEVEYRITQAVGSGENVKYLVIPRYAGNSLVPQGITCLARGDRGLNTSVTLLNDFIR